MGKMMSNQKFVLFLDILGFSQLASNNSSSELKKIYDYQFIKSASTSAAISQGIFGTQPPRFKVSTNPDGTLNDIQQDDINFHVMSDSLIAWTNDDTFDSFVKLSNFASIYLSQTFIFGLPHRGAISIGEVDIIELPLNNQMQKNIIGSGVIYAHNYESGQNWMGCVIDPLCILNTPKDFIDKLTKLPRTSISKYWTPYKSNARYRSNLVINWTINDLAIKSDQKFFTHQFGRYHKGLNENIKTKIDNTFNFYRDMKNTC